MKGRVLKWEAKTAGVVAIETASVTDGDRPSGADPADDAIRGPGHRPLLSPTSQGRFVAYPFYSVAEVAFILGLSDDFVRALFRDGRHGPVIEICNRRPGRRIYRTLLIPYSTWA